MPCKISRSKDLGFILKLSSRLLYWIIEYIFISTIIQQEESVQGIYEASDPLCHAFNFVFTTTKTYILLFNYIVYTHRTWWSYSYVLFIGLLKLFISIIRWVYHEFLTANFYNALMPDDAPKIEYHKAFRESKTIGGTEILFNEMRKWSHVTFGGCSTHIW